jgi:hypothetical protein
MSKITTPEEFFGHQLGADRKIARWDRIVEYFNKLQEESEKIKVIDLGPSTEGNNFNAVLITSKENMRNLDELQRINQRIADPIDLTEETAKPLIAKGKAVAIQSMSLHATEIGGTQMAPELAYDLLTRNDEETRRILDNVICIMVPSFNPDGQIMVTDWYNKYLGTEYEGVNTPFLYHKYAGHDNNRDAFMTNLVESQHMAQLMFHDWPPQAYQDHHHMGSYGARLYVAPYSDPIHPYGDPLVWRELSWYGSHMAYKLEENDKTGILNGAVFSGWAHLGFHWIGIYHNIPSMLTESASAKLATPLYIHPEQLIEETKPGSLVGTRMFPHYKPTTNFPNPWPGGWWRLRDIVEQQKIAAWALLDHMARNRETVLWNTFQKALRQTTRGDEGSPGVIIIPHEQHDARTSELLVEKLVAQNIDIYRSKEPFTADGFLYEKGSYIVPLAQPKMGLIMTLLCQTRFPDDSFTRQTDGTPHRPYDTATDTIAEFMGVSAYPADYVSDVDVEKVTEYEPPEGHVDDSSKVGYLLDTRENAAFKAVNLLLNAGATITRAVEPLMVGDQELPPGCFIVEPGSEEQMKTVATETGLTFHALELLEAEIKEVKQLKVGVYQRYWGGNTDEGWTRLCLEHFNFAYKTIMDKDILEGDLTEYDAIILPNDPLAIITGGEDLEKWWRENRSGSELPNYPPEYRSGLGDQGRDRIKEWVKKGGRLICLGDASEYGIEALELKVANVLKDLKPKEFHCPGSTLHVNVDVFNCLAYGMQEDALALFWNSPAFKIIPNPNNEKYHVVVTYPDSDILESGWLLGEEKIANKIAMIDVDVEEGRVILIGFRCQHRCQTHGTFKLLFNSLLS